MARTVRPTNVVPIPESKKRPSGMWGRLLSAARALPRRERTGTSNRRLNPFTPAQPMPGVVGKDDNGNQLKPNIPQIAQDVAEAFKLATDDWVGGPGSGWLGGYAGGYFASAYAEGQEWLGYAVLAIMSQRPEYRIAVDTYATEMTREWIDFKSKSEDHDKQPKIDELVTRLTELQLKSVVKAAIENDGFQGRGQIYIDTGDGNDPDELKTPIGRGGDDTRAKFGRDGLAHDLSPGEDPGPEEASERRGKKRIKRLSAIEPMWCYPSQYNASDPLMPDWYRPEFWWVMGKEVHRTRLLTFVSNPVPDMLKAAYSFGGLSLTQMGKPYVDFWLRNRTSASDLLSNFSVPVLSTELDVVAMNEGSELLQRVQTFNVLRDNQSTMVINKDSEEFNIAAAPLGGVKDLVAQSAEHMCLTGDALIETQRGAVRIRDVCSSDQVLTRSGLAPLAWAGVTGYSEEIVEIEISDGLFLRATPCHPVYLPTIDEFVPAQNVWVGDFLLTCDDTPASTASQSYGGGIGGTERKLDIIAVRRSIRSSIRRFGGRIADLSRMATSFTMRMITRTIINPGIWTLRHDPVTMPSISLVGDWDSISCLPELCRARTAVSYLRQVRVILGSAVKSVDSASPEEFEASLRGAMGILRYVLRVVAGSLSPSRLSGDVIAASAALPRCTTRVVAVKRFLHREVVYNLSVAAGFPPEFFANGVLVHNCVPWRIPIVKFFGNQPSGLNADSEGVIRLFYDRIKAMQEGLLREPIQTIVNMVEIELWGEVDDDIEFEFEPLWQLDEAGKAAIQKTKADQRAVDIEARIILPDEGRMAAARDPDSQYSGLDLHEPLPEPDPMEMFGPEGEEGEDPGGVGKPTRRDFASGITNTSAKFGAPATGGFKNLDERPPALTASDFDYQ